MVFFSTGAIFYNKIFFQYKHLNNVYLINCYNQENNYKENNVHIYWKCMSFVWKKRLMLKTMFGLYLKLENIGSLSDSLLIQTLR